MVPALSDEAWALLGVLHRAISGGPPAPLGFETAYAQLQEHGLVIGKTITSKGREVFSERFLSSNPDLLGSKKQPKDRHS